MTRYRTSMAIGLAEALVIAVAVCLPLSPAFGEGGARRDVVRHAAEGSENAGPASRSKNATIMDWDGKENHKGTHGWTCMPDNLERQARIPCASTCRGSIFGTR